MQNKEFFANYGTENWAIEENLCYMLQEYWEAVRTRTGIGKTLTIQLPLNPVSFIKEFMKEETLVDVKYVEQSKLSNLEKNEVRQGESDTLNPPTDFIKGEFREMNTPADTKPSEGLKLIWPNDENFYK